MTVLRLGTRRSSLAIAQSTHVAQAITAATGVGVELVPIVSEGDTSRASLSEIGGTGVFATRLREALVAGRCDLLVHSLKDLPTAPAPGLVLGAIPVREDARDVLVSRGPSLGELALGAKVGTGSPRRVAQLRGRAPGVHVQDLRGNVDSRLQRVRSGELDAIVLAAAGLRRLGLIDDLDEGAVPGRGTAAGLVIEPFGLAEWPTAAGQGALAVEIAHDAPSIVADSVAVIDDLATRIEVTTERTVLSEIEAGCHAPVGMHADLTDDDLRVRAAVYAADGTARIGIDRTTGPVEGYSRGTGGGDGADATGGADPIAQAQRFGIAIAQGLLERGAADLVSRESS